jgi:hypothetical protein
VYVKVERISYGSPPLPTVDCSAGYAVLGVCIHRWVVEGVNDKGRHNGAHGLRLKASMPTYLAPC